MSERSNAEIEGIKLHYDVSKVIALTCFAAVASLIIFFGGNLHIYNDWIGRAILGLLLAGMCAFASAILCVLELRATVRMHWYTVTFLAASFLLILVSLFFGTEAFEKIVDGLVAK